MTATIALLLLLTQAPQPSLGPEWQTLPLETAEYASYVRHNADGTDTKISAIKTVCACKPEVAAGSVVTALATIPESTMKVEHVGLCGVSALHLVATGLADTDERSNMDLYFFRRGDAIYGLRYYFKTAAPQAEDEALLPRLCPAAADA